MPRTQAMVEAQKRYRMTHRDVLSKATNKWRSNNKDKVCQYRRKAHDKTPNALERIIFLQFRRMFK